MNSELLNNGKKEKKVSGTREWASRTVNFIGGCRNDCKYCYAKSMAVRFKRKTSETWKDEIVIPDKLKLVYLKKPESIMFPSSHDISPKNVGIAMQMMDRLFEKGNHVLIVTKPHLSVIEEICGTFTDKKGNILFRFTIGSNSSETLKFWEPGAPTFEERLEALKYAFNSGFQTSVSCEPALDTNTAELVEILLPFVTDAVWIGLPNRLKGILKLNGVDDDETMQRAKDLMASQSNEWIFSMYEKLGNNPKIKWKDSVKKIVGIDRPIIAGLDI